MLFGVHMKQEQGFTLIELLTVIGIIGILASLGITSFSYYKASAAFASAEQTLHDARNAIEAAVVDQDNLPASVPLTNQKGQGQIQDATAAAYLPGLMLPRNLDFNVSYDNTCSNAACTKDFIQVRHCSGEKYIRWLRYGDGVEVKLEPSGSGC